MSKQINVVGAVVIRAGAVLAAQRSQTMSLPGLWEFPGGKIESRESPQEALAREIQEELLCRVSVGERVEATTYEYEFGVVALTTFYATILDGEPQVTEHADLRWIPMEDLHNLNWAPADLPAMRRVLRDHAA
ncbi:(deoxy)nucleoside triphosphate pyrophosphohydrolase [Microbacterium sp. AGC85]